MSHLSNFTVSRIVVRGKHLHVFVTRLARFRALSIHNNDGWCRKSNEKTHSPLADSISADTTLRYISARLQHSISSRKRCHRRQIIIVNKPLFKCAWQNCENVFFSCLDLCVLFSRSSLNTFRIGESVFALHTCILKQNLQTMIQHIFFLIYSQMVHKSVAQLQKYMQ